MGPIEQGIFQARPDLQGGLELPHGPGNQVLGICSRLLLGLMQEGDPLKKMSQG